MPCAQSVYKLMPLDGIWLDMNEVSNYCSGDVCMDPGVLSLCQCSPFVSLPVPHHSPTNIVGHLESIGLPAGVLFDPQASAIAQGS